MLIEVAETHPPQYGKKVATVIAKGGDKFEIWPEKLADLKAGAKYEVDVAEQPMAPPSPSMVTPQSQRRATASLSSSPPCSPR